MQQNIGYVLTIDFRWGVNRMSVLPGISLASSVVGEVLDPAKEARAVTQHGSSFHNQHGGTSINILSNNVFGLGAALDSFNDILREHPAKFWFTAGTILLAVLGGLAVNPVFKPLWNKAYEFANAEPDAVVIPIEAVPHHLTRPHLEKLGLAEGVYQARCTSESGSPVFNVTVEANRRGTKTFLRTPEKTYTIMGSSSGNVDVMSGVNEFVQEGVISVRPNTGEFILTMTAARWACSRFDLLRPTQI